MSFYSHTFIGATETLGSRESRKIANNTYLIRRDDETIAVKLHATDVISYHSDGTVTLRSGGYETVTTKDRMNNFGPDGMRVFSDKRIWFVRIGSDSTPFVSGMRFDPARLMETTADLRTDADDSLARARKTEREIMKFVKTLDPDRLSEIVSGARQAMGMLGDCLICRVELSEIVDKGRKANCLTSGDASHITSHLCEDYWHATLILCALVWAGYDLDRAGNVIGYHSIVIRILRRYLRARLIVAPSVAEGTARPVFAGMADPETTAEYARSWGFRA